MSLILIHELQQQLERKEQRIIQLEQQLEMTHRELRQHLQEHTEVTEGIVKDEILKNLKFNTKYTDYTHGNNYIHSITVKYGNQLINDIYLD